MPLNSLKRLLLAASLLCLPGLSVHGRIGDTPRDMDGRILRPNVGRHFSTRGLNERELNQFQRDLPTTAFARYLPDDLREVVYWKSARSRQLSNDNGWRVHVHYWKDRSVLEAYRRVGESLSEFETNALLILNRGGQTWRKVERAKGPRAEAQADTVIGYDFELGEDGLRAKVEGDWLLIYLTRFDRMLVEKKKEQDALDQAEAEQRRLEQQQKAPESIEGF
ncbi:MAG: hypothetical protein ABII82_16865 [Verrucomicrobiota bacterium]